MTTPCRHAGDDGTHRYPRPRERCRAWSRRFPGPGEADVVVAARRLVARSAVRAHVLAAGVLYTVGVRRLAARGRRWPVGRSAAFGAGLALIVLATQSGLAQYDTVLFSLHVVQHLLARDGGAGVPRARRAGDARCCRRATAPAQARGAPHACAADRWRSSRIRSWSGCCSAGRSSSSTSPASTSSRSAIGWVHVLVARPLRRRRLPVHGVRRRRRPAATFVRLRRTPAVRRGGAPVPRVPRGRAARTDTVLAPDWYAKVVAGLGRRIARPTSGSAPGCCGPSASCSGSSRSASCSTSGCVTTSWLPHVRIVWMSERSPCVRPRSQRRRGRRRNVLVREDSNATTRLARVLRAGEPGRAFRRESGSVGSPEVGAARWDRAGVR